MFIQVIEGRTHDAEGLHRQMEVWERDLAPGAVGYLGSTGGVSGDGDCILIARFESEEAARRNSDRPEQTAWWEQTRRCFDGPVAFHEATDVVVMRHGDPDAAQFVQVMEGRVTDVEEAHRLGDAADPVLATSRPDLLETITAFHPDGAFTEVAYFTNEAEARRNESGEMTDEMARTFARWEQVMHVDRYVDLRQPWLVTA